MTKRIPTSRFHEIYNEVPRICVDLYLDVDGGVLLTKRCTGHWTGSWHMPGGTMRFTESIEDTAKRIAKGELGIDIDVCETLGIIEYPLEKLGEGMGHSIAIVVRAVPKSLDITLDDCADEWKVFSGGLPESTISEVKEFISRSGLL